MKEEIEKISSKQLEKDHTITKLKKENEQFRVQINLNQVFFFFINFFNSFQTGIQQRTRENENNN